MSDYYEPTNEMSEKNQVVNQGINQTERRNRACLHDTGMAAQKHGRLG